MSTLSELSDAMVRCKTIGHSWDDFIPFDKKPPAFGDRLSFRCVRCTTERHDICSWVDGSLVGRTYVYPEEYRLTEKGLQRNDLRLELMHRVHPKAARAYKRKARRAS